MKSVFALAFLLTESAVAIGLVCLTLLFWRFTNEDLSSLEGIADDIKPPVATTIWSQDNVLLGQLDAENRQPIPLAKVPKQMQEATIAIEDHRFYEHSGVDPVGVLRAVVANVRSNNHSSQGGSTLTQQLVRNLNQFGISKEKKFGRKVREAFTAIRLEQLYTKNEILELYLNNIYYGGGAYGVEAAAQTYFGKPVAKLDLSEVALLAGLPQRPRSLTPFEHKKAALVRRDEVLDKMLEYGSITQADHDKAKKETLHIMKRRPHKNFEFKAPYFVTYVLRQLIRQYGAEYVYSGLKIETTLNWEMQKQAEEAMRNGLSHAAFVGANQGALVSLDNHTGYIRAMVGGRSFTADQFNAVTQGRRQPGSTFKLFDYAAAFDTGTASLNSYYLDAPMPYPNDPQHRSVKNFDGSSSGAMMSCLTAIQFSKNTVAVRVAAATKIKTVISYAYRMGISKKVTPLAPYLPTALGASAVRPIDLASAYSVVAMQGKRCPPMSITRILDSNDNVQDERLPEIMDNILKPETTAQLDKALQAVVESGTGTMARGTEANGIVEGARGKTGTTSDNRDAWFAGYTPELTTVIWVASVHRSHGVIRYATMNGATGGHLCAPIWHNFMVQAVPVQRKFKTDAPSIHIESPTTAIPIAKPKKKWKQKETPTADEPDAIDDSADKTAPENKADTPAETADPATDGTDTGTPKDSGTETAPPLPDEQLPSRPGDDKKDKTPDAPRTNLRTRPPAAPKRATEETDALVTVEVCDDTGHLARTYCPSRHSVHVTAAQKKRMIRCPKHRPPPGETE